MEPPVFKRELSVDSYTSFQPSQQADSMALFAEREPISKLPSGFAKQEQEEPPDTCLFTQAVCHPSPRPPLHSTPAHDPETDAHMSPFPSYQTSSQHAWPSPPLGPGDIQSSSLFCNSPAPGSTYLPCFTSSSVSLAELSSPASNFHPQSGLYEHQRSTDSPAFIRIRTPTSVQDSPLSLPDMPAMYPRSLQPESTCQAAISLEGLHGLPESPRMAPNLPALPISSGTGSPDGLRANTPVSLVVIPKGKSMQPPTVDIFRESRVAYDPRGSGTVNSAKNDEPYAKLIHRAFMSQPDHAMTLQDIYKWFRENTNKTTNEKSGWQNSIRHNLSMNAAFTRRDRKQAGASGPSSALDGKSTLTSDAKRTNEWVLEDWAVRDGVQSTTRYRKGNSGRRPARCASNPSGVGQNRTNSQHSSTRALSGRKGGCAARNSRYQGQGDLPYNQQWVVQSSDHSNRLINESLDSPLTSSIPGPYYSAPLPVSRLDAGAIQTPVVHGHGVSSNYGPESTATEPFVVQMADGRMGQAVADGNGGCHSGIHSMSPYVGQQDHMYLTPSPDFPYNISDVQLDYSSAHSNAGASDQGRLFEAIPGGVNDWDHHQDM